MNNKHVVEMEKVEVRKIEVFDKGIAKDNLESAICCMGPYMAIR